MKLVDSIFVSSPAPAVWAFLIDPENMRRWNPKVIRVSPSCFSEPRPGYRYAITYQMHPGAKPSEFSAEFVRFEPPSTLGICLTERSSPKGRVIEESYELSPRDSGTFLTQTIRTGNSGVSIFLRLLFWLLQRWGKPTGKPYLATLRDIIESERKPDREYGAPL